MIGYKRNDIPQILLFWKIITTIFLIKYNVWHCGDHQYFTELGNLSHSMLAGFWELKTKKNLPVCVARNDITDWKNDWSIDWLILH